MGFLLSNRIWSFTICNQVTEAWLAPFVCGVYFVLCLIWKTGGGLCGGRSHIHPMKLQFNLFVLAPPCEAELKQKRLNFSSSQENGIIICIVYCCCFCSFFSLCMIYFTYLISPLPLFVFPLHADFFGLETFL